MILTDPEAHFLQELVRNKLVLQLGNDDGQVAYRMAFAAGRIDVVDHQDKDGLVLTLNATDAYDNVWIHIGESEDIVPIFIPNFDVTVIVDSQDLYHDLDLAFDKTKFGGTIAVYSLTSPNEGIFGEWMVDRRTWAEVPFNPFPADTQFDPRTGQPFVVPVPTEPKFHPPTITTVGNIDSFVVNWR